MCVCVSLCVYDADEEDGTDEGEQVKTLNVAKSEQFEYGKTNTRPIKSHQ